MRVWGGAWRGALLGGVALIVGCAGGDSEMFRAPGPGLGPGPGAGDDPSELPPFDPEDTDGGSTGSGEPYPPDAPDETSGGNPGSPEDPTGAPTPYTGPPIVFLQFETVTLGLGNEDDSRTDTVEHSPHAGTWPGVDAARADAIAREVESFLAPFDIHVTDTRPAASKPYTMVVVTSAEFPASPNSTGAALSDCGNQNDSGVVLVFDDPGRSHPIEVIANSVGTMLGVSFGLNLVGNEPSELMSLNPDDSSRLYTVTCLPIEQGSCAPVSGACPAGEQSSRAEMLARFGPA